MKKVITYGTYDFLHDGHIRLLKRAKNLGDYLVVGVTADDFDKKRGKVNVHQSLMERIESVKSTNIADEIIIEEYEGQKIDDIRRLGIDVFTVGSDWIGKFDYLKEYCEVVYLPRTEGISSSMIRSSMNDIRLGLVGESILMEKIQSESSYVNGLKISAICTKYPECLPEKLNKTAYITSDYEKILDNVDAVYIFSQPKYHYEQIRMALMQEKHVICETPKTLNFSQCIELHKIAKDNGLIFQEGNKTAYTTAYTRLLLLIKTGVIGEIISVDATSTSLSEKYIGDYSDSDVRWNSIEAWGAKSLLPIFQILGTEYVKKDIVSHIEDDNTMFDTFTKIDFIYPKAVASIKVGKGVKSEGELLVSGTNGYIYVPAPWWKTDYFEVRFENPAENKRYFYALEGEGIRNEMVSFIKSIENRKNNNLIDDCISEAIVKVLEDYYSGIDLTRI